MSDIQVHNFTIEYNSKVRVIETEVIIGHPDRLTYEINPKGKYNAIWDTGAESSVITKRVAQDLGLFPVSKIQVHGVTGSSMADVYLVSILLPNNVVVSPIRVTECAVLSGNFDVLIGMDIIGSGDFSVTNSENKTVMSYRFPSVSRIDFTSPEKTFIHQNGNASPLTRQQRRALERIENKNKRRK